MDAAPLLLIVLDLALLLREKTTSKRLAGTLILPRTKETTLNEGTTIFFSDWMCGRGLKGGLFPLVKVTDRAHAHAASSSVGNSIMTKPS